MPFRAILTLACLLPYLAGISGCSSMGEPGDITPKSLLQAAGTSPQTVTLDIYWARTQADSDTINDQLWQSVQEDRIPVEVRRSLAENGLRAGIVGGTPNPTIVGLLQSDQLTSEDQQLELLQGKAKATRQQIQLREGRRKELQTTGETKDRVLLQRKGGQLVGQPYGSALGIYGLEIGRAEGDRVELDITPELQFGQPRYRLTPTGPGTAIQSLARDKEVFENLRMKVSLTSGEMLVISSLPRARNRLGGHFHNFATEEGLRQKVLLIRLSHVPASQEIALAGESSWPVD